eukprot:6313313-Alexandrium_andersonii.AAC.1
MASSILILNCAGPRTASNVHSVKACPGDSASLASCCVLNPMVATKQAGGRPGGAFRRGPG